MCAHFCCPMILSFCLEEGFLITSFFAYNDTSLKPGTFFIFLLIFVDKQIKKKGAQSCLELQMERNLPREKVFCQHLLASEGSWRGKLILIGNKLCKNLRHYNHSNTFWCLSFN